MRLKVADKTGEQSDTDENVLRFSLNLKTAANYTNLAYICNKL